MNPRPRLSVRQRYVDAICRSAASDRGAPLIEATNVVAAADRAGSAVAVVYPLGARTVVWCAADLRPRLSELEGRPALGADEFVEAGLALGGELVGYGRHRVLSSRLEPPSLDPAQLVVLDRQDAGDVARISAFVADCTAEELDDAELDLEELDPAIVAVLDADGAIAAFASARPWSFDADFDDIAVITHPARRGEGLATTAVRALITCQQPTGRLMFYNCDVENRGSNAVAESLGFELVCTVAAVSFT